MPVGADGYPTKLQLTEKCDLKSVCFLYCYEVAAISWVVPLYIALITHSLNSSQRSRHAMAFGLVV